MRIDAISIGRDPPREVNVIVEVPVGGEPIKYEMDKAAGTLVVDRFLYTAMRYPGNYGFVPHTLSDDGDPCDVLIASQRGIVPGAVIAVRPVGVLKMQDEAGGDEKIIAVPVSRLTQRYDKIARATPTCRTSRSSRSSTSSSTTRTSSPASGSRSSAGAGPKRPRSSSSRRSTGSGSTSRPRGGARRRCAR